MPTLFDTPWITLALLVVLTSASGFTAFALRKKSHRISRHSINLLAVFAVTFLFMTGLYLFGMATNGIGPTALIGTVGITLMLSAVALEVTTVVVWWLPKDASAQRQ